MINSEKMNSFDTKKKKKYTSALRFWHWGNTLFLLVSLLTVLINATLFDKSQTGFVKTELQKSGAVINIEQARSVTHGLEDQVWGIHTYFGYALVALFIFRIISEFLSPSKPLVFTVIKRAYVDYFILKRQRELAGHELLVKSLYLLFYLLLLMMSITGLLLAFEDSTGISRAVNHSIKEVHGFCMYLILGFIFIHILGVFLAERKEGKGMVSDMINGGEGQ